MGVRVNGRAWNEHQHPRDRAGRFSDRDDTITTTSRSRGGDTETTRTPAGTWSGGREPYGDVQYMSAQELRDGIRYGTDGFQYHTDRGWNELLDRQRDDPRTPAWMEDIRQNGMEPIQVNWDDVPDGMGGSERQGEIRNGNHRLALAVLMNLRAVPVSRRDYETWDQGNNRVRVRL